MKSIILVIVVMGLGAFAQQSSTSLSSQQTNESSAKIQNLQKNDEKLKDIDDEITNARLRAALGSKSLWSVRTSMNYQGGTINRAFAERRPNYRSAVATNDQSFFDANIAVKRRLGDKDSLNFGSGITAFTPFHRTLDEATNSGDGRRNLTVSNPFLEYNIAYKMGDLQASTALTYVHSTNDFDVNRVKTLNTVSFDQTLIAMIGTSFSYGASLSAWKTFYRGASDFDGRGEQKLNLSAGLYPFLEYAFNDKYAYRTVFGYFEFQEFMSNKEGQSQYGRFRQLTPYQSMGIGISFSRDIWVYPNIQFVPQDIRDDRTNVGLAANINIF
ncbi:MAG: hypothetical protein ACK5Y2_07680 [Bdellovibrionales bacterium]